MLDKFCELASTGLTPVLYGVANSDLLQEIVKRVETINTVHTSISSDLDEKFLLSRCDGTELHQIVSDRALNVPNGKPLPLLDIPNAVIGYVHEGKIIGLKYPVPKEAVK